MPTPAGVHSMGWTTRTEQSLQSWVSQGNEAAARSCAGKVAQAAGGNEEAGEEDGVLAKMHEITRGDGSGFGANVREDDTDADEQADLAPGAAELLRMRKSKKRARGDNACGDPKFASNDRVDAAAENRLFDQGSHENSQGHEHQNALAAAEKFFHGNAGFATDEISEPAHHNSQGESAKDVAQHDRTTRGHVAETAPAHRLPKRRGTAAANDDIKKYQRGAGKQGLANDQHRSPFGGGVSQGSRRYT